MGNKIDKPEKPLPSDCCGGGACCPCVWDDYFEKLQVWQEQENKGEQPANGDESTQEAEEPEQTRREIWR